MVHRSIQTIFALTLVVAGAAGQDTPRKSPPLHVAPSRLRAHVGDNFNADVTISGGTKPYSIADPGKFPKLSGLSVGIDGENTLHVYGTCDLANVTDFLNVVDHSGEQVKQVSFLCDAEPATEYKSFLGIQQSQPASSDRTWKMASNLGVSLRVRDSVRFVLDLDATSVPQQVDFKVSQVPAQASSLVKNMNVNQAVQSLNLLAGLEFPSIVPRAVLAVKPILLGGFSTPLSPQEAVKVYDANPQALQALGINTTQPYLALTTPDRSRFYAQYYAGVRLKTFDFFKGAASGSNYPAYVDITPGMNSAVTGGQLRRFVSRVSGYVPIPGTPFSVVGSAYLALQKNQNSTPVFLTPDPSISLPNPNAYIYSKAENRDFYQIGIAMDLVTIIKKVPSVMKAIQ
ncbi:MAG TPA: hypothetical protein VKX45_16965 [Bryobacteraceae bacterium]|jgi:hypothetical protein|nr:hypothetical protein [Bryobacteraceae bacterium]